MRTRSYAAVTIVALAALGTFASTAAADQPTTTVTQRDSTRTITGLCDFPVVVHSEGTLRETVYSSGKDVTHTVDFHITYTNPENGKTVSTVLGGPAIIEPNGDGTVTVTVNGNDGHSTAPGQGEIYSAVGKLVYIADPADVFTPLAIVKSTGQQDPAQFPATCAGLS